MGNICVKSLNNRPAGQVMLDKHLFVMAAIFVWQRETVLAILVEAARAKNRKIFRQLLNC